MDFPTLFHFQGGGGFPRKENAKNQQFDPPREGGRVWTAINGDLVGMRILGWNLGIGVGKQFHKMWWMLECEKYCREKFCFLAPNLTGGETKFIKGGARGSLLGRSGQHSEKSPGI